MCVIWCSYKTKRHGTSFSFFFLRISVCGWVLVQLTTFQFPLYNLELRCQHLKTIYHDSTKKLDHFVLKRSSFLDTVFLKMSDKIDARLPLRSKLTSRVASSGTFSLTKDSSFRWNLLSHSYWIQMIFFIISFQETFDYFKEFQTSGQTNEQTRHASFFD